MKLAITVPKRHICLKNEKFVNNWGKGDGTQTLIASLHIVSLLEFFQSNLAPHSQPSNKSTLWKINFDLT